jgi:hypothetical protein
MGITRPEDADKDCRGWEREQAFEAGKCPLAFTLAVVISMGNEKDVSTCHRPPEKS